MKPPGFFPAIFLSFWIAVFPVHASKTSIDLPSLGDATSGIISPQQEYELGRTYLKVIRSQTPTVSDPELKDYLERLISRLAASSEIIDHRLITLVIDNTTINAFAAPGGIVGVNTGLFLNADTEAQFAAVLAHELAHLSQRHYARNVEEARNKSLPTAAAILASVLIMAAGGADAGAAALTSTVAGLQSSRLKFSRQYEREADNMGIQTLARAGFDPHAMPEIFEQMNKSSRYGSRPPEFLSTHPVTENRIADSRARADQFQSGGSKGGIDFQLMKMRTLALSAKNPHELIKQLSRELETGHTGAPNISRYGLALTAIQTRDFTTAAKQLDRLLKTAPDNLHYILARANLDANSGNATTALKTIDKALEIHLDYYPLLATKAKILTQTAAHMKKEDPLTRQYQQDARTILLKLSQMRPEDPDIWYELAEAQGQAQDILGLHQARAEYFFLTGNLDDAIRHIEYAKKLAGDRYAIKAKLDKKLADMYEYRRKVIK
ncbi:M48 family metalloprotease [Endozoicomonas sp. Mp262]|uniref:M48 family metalloprotease n=1 Tax=Endozoicomonas sp. Mp262 TaxID=2919499 RepID=UPI0021DA624A